LVFMAETINLRAACSSGAYCATKVLRGCGCGFGFGGGV